VEFRKIVTGVKNRREAEATFKKWLANQCAELKIDCDIMTYSVRSPGPAQKAIDKKIGQKGHEYIFTYREKKAKRRS
jgi:hypothetical protein